MKVLIAVSQYHRRGGFPRYGAQIAVGLARRGHEVTVLTRSAEPGPDDGAIHFLSYRVPEPTTLVLMATEPVVLTLRLRRLAASYDVVIAVGLPVLAPVVLFGTGTHLGYVKETLRAAPRHSRRWWVERLRPFHRVVNAWEWLMLKGGFPRLVFVGGQRFRQEYIDLYGWDPDKVVALPLAVERDEFAFDPGVRTRTRAELGIPDDAFVMVNVAGRGRQKGLDVLADALTELPVDRRWLAIFAGTGANDRALATRTASLEAEGRVMRLGPVDRVADLYSAADLCVFPSRYDPWGLVVTEALAAGLPVVASSRAGSSVAVVEGVNGTVLADPTDAVQVASAIQRLWDRSFDRAEVAATVDHLGIDERAADIEQHLRGL